ncbi:hypothetical protein [Streptomyces sp. NPDC005969]|uniref:hypothetical protein n=1 Tax=Streptomyces sp. NPDC005969 TaxID=3156722 RepID=UPI0033F4B8F7
MPVTTPSPARARYSTTPQTTQKGTTMSPYLMTAADLAALSSGDDATVSDLAARRRARTTVAQAEQAAAATDPERLARSLLSEFRAAWSVGDHDQMTNVVLAAIDLDRSVPDAPRLMDEIRGFNTQAAA